MIDFNCYIGEWPFYKLRSHTFEDLKEVHKKNNIDYGYISSIHSIFYNDFYESEKELYEEIKGSPYKQVVTVNPMLSGAALTLKRCINEFDVKGVRLFPGYHGYNIKSDILNPVLEVVRENKLPLFITFRMHDERVSYLIHPEMINVSDLECFINNNSDIVTVLSHIKLNEAGELKETILNNPRAFVDTTFFESNIIENEDIYDLYKNAVYGSGFPLRTVTSGMVLINTEIDDEKIKEIVLKGTAINKYLLSH